jgi:hypothetical protein
LKAINNQKIEFIEMSKTEFPFSNLIHQKNLFSSRNFSNRKQL